MEYHAFLPCKVSKGMFDTENAVEIILPNGETISLFADKELIREVKGNTYLRVNVVVDDKTHQTKVLLPTESFEKGSRWLSMPSDRLVPA